jgi:hypothetical protein
MKLLLATLMILISNLGLASEKAGDHKPKFIIYEPEAAVNANATAPDRPKILSPEPLKVLSESDITLRWNAIQDADAYSVQVSDDANFFKILTNESLYPQTEYTFRGAEKGKIYYWRVAALRTGNKPGTQKSLYNRSSFSVQ